MNEPKLEINGKKYYSATYNLCPVCDPDYEQRYLCVKFETSNKDVVLECPICDYNITVAASMININADKAKRLGMVDDVELDEE
jgi:uncharacterized Zn finger protein